MLVDNKLWMESIWLVEAEQLHFCVCTTKFIEGVLKEAHTHKEEPHQSKPVYAATLHALDGVNQNRRS